MVRREQEGWKWKRAFRDGEEGARETIAAIPIMSTIPMYFDFINGNVEVKLNMLFHFFW